MTCSTLNLPHPSEWHSILPTAQHSAILNASLSVILSVSVSLSSIPRGKHQQILPTLTSKFISVSSTPHPPVSLPLDQPPSSLPWSFIPVASLFPGLLPLLPAVYSPHGSQRDPIPRRVRHSLVLTTLQWAPSHSEKPQAL